MGPFRWISDSLEKVESVLASLGLLFMISLAFLQVLLRNFWDTGIGWGDPIVRALVLWVGFLGASIATHQKGHISFDVVSKFLPPRINRVAKLLVHFTSAVVCVLLAKAAYDFVAMEKEFGTMLVEQIPNWIAVIIIPISFLIMAFRMAIHGFEDILSFFKAQPVREES
ncbi:MAG: TRAP transporter small permease [bacterium]|nr:TRAP transporter small permease [bacterium]